MKEIKNQLPLALDSTMSGKVNINEVPKYKQTGFDSTISEKDCYICVYIKDLSSGDIPPFVKKPLNIFISLEYEGKQYETKKIRIMPNTQIVFNTEINFLFKITNFEYSEQNGTRDVYYTLSLKEFREITIPGLNSNTQSTNNTQNTPRKDNASSNINKTINDINKTINDINKTINDAIQKIYTVKKGDCLWDISKKYYGTGSDYKKIIEANKEKYKNLKKNTIIKPDWKLNIP